VHILILYALSVIYLADVSFWVAVQLCDLIVEYKNIDMSRDGVFCVCNERSGVTAGNDEFQQAVHRAVPDGHTFKGYPVQLVHRNPRRAFNSCLKSVLAGAVGTGVDVCKKNMYSV